MGKRSPKGKPIIRKTYPGRPKDTVIQERVAEMVGLLARSPAVQRCNLHKVFCPKWNCHWLTVDRVLIRARKVIFERMSRPKEQFRVESLAFYESISTDPDATAGEKIRARQRVDEVLGLDAPRRAEVSGPEGAPIAFGEVKVYVPAKRALVPAGNGELESGNGDDGERGNGEATGAG